MPKPSFVFNDESIENSYGFSILTAGIGLSRFKNNPVMLNNHINSTSNVLGKWEKVKKSKGLLTGSPIFDSKDKEVKQIEGKVDRGFVKSCSMGISFNREDLKLAGGKLILTKCELYEVSIVAIPSNANSIRLYVGDDKTPLTDQEIQELCLSITDETQEVKITKKNNENNKNMKITLSAAVCAIMGVTVGTEMDTEELNAKFLALNAEKTAVEVQLSALKAAEESAKLAAIELKVTNAIKANPALAAQKQSLIDLGIANEQLLDSTLSVLPVKASLAAQVTSTGATEVKTVEAFMKLDHEAKLAFKAEQPEVYKQLFTNKN